MMGQKKFYIFFCRTFFIPEKWRGNGVNSVAERQGNELMAGQALDALVEALKTGSLHGGQFLSMPQLVETLGFPIAAVREAVKQAGSFGLMIIIPKRGVKVMETGPDITRDCLDIRAILDQEGARRLIRTGNRLDLSALRDAHLRIRDLAGNRTVDNLTDMAIKTDLSLHDFLSTGLFNPIAEDSYAVNRIRIAIIQNSRPFVRNRILSAMDEHLEIIDALQEQDAERAVHAIGVHYENTLEWWGV
jgi:DNA-binding GntR family transcriptional regulator